MSQTHTHHLTSLLAVFAIVLLSMVVPQPRTQGNDTSRKTLFFPALSVGAFRAQAASTETPEERAMTRVALRMSKRIARLQRTSPPISSLLGALQEQRKLLQGKTTVTLVFPVTEAKRTWEVSLQRYPTWMKAEFTAGSAHFRVDAQRVRDYLTREPMDGLTAPHDTVITAIVQDGDIQRVITNSGAARSGITFDFPAASETLADALTKGTEAITMTLIIAPGRIINTTGESLGDLTLLGTGKSDFRGSPDARITNIRKALNTHVNNVLVQPGETFSFNKTLGGSVSERNGWKLAKVIFNAKDLVMAPGGGICQASTTVFRAMLQAGFTPVQRANHSMYVSYYEKYGVGIDATVFPGKQDLTFVNDSGHPLLLQAYEEGTEATVSIYGTADGRTATVEGPYFWNSDLSEFPAEQRPPRKNEIVWVQRITYPDGNAKQSMVTSRYSGLPASIAKKYNDLHASAHHEPLQASVSQR